MHMQKHRAKTHNGTHQCSPSFDKIITGAINYMTQQDRQALLKAKYCLQVAPVASAGINEVEPSSE